MIRHDDNRERWYENEKEGWYEVKHEGDEMRLDDTIWYDTMREGDEIIRWWWREIIEM